MAKKLSTEEYIQQVKDKYDLSKVVYNSKRKKITVVCPIHGKFEVFPLNFLKGSGCLCHKWVKKC